MVATRFLIVLGGAFAVLAPGSVLLGRTVPEPYASFAPLHHASMRAEMARDKALYGRDPCIVLIGDSRIAFNINAKMLERPGCQAVNLGFPLTSLDLIFGLAHDAKMQSSRGVQVVVMAFTEPLVLHARPPAIPQVVGDRPGPTAPLPRLSEREVFERRFVAWLMEWPLYRWALMSLYRATTYLRSFIRATALPAPLPWRWAEQQGRWVWGEIEDRRFSDRTDLEQAVDVIATSYFTHRVVNPDNDIKAAMKAMKSIGSVPIAILAPLHSSFIDAAERIRPGIHHALRAAVKRVAAEEDVIVLDCIVATNCNLTDRHFADPVHLNSDGARAFTEWLKRELAGNAAIAGRMASIRP